MDDDVFLKNNFRSTIAITLRNSGPAEKVFFLMKETTLLHNPLYRRCTHQSELASRYNSPIENCDGNRISVLSGFIMNKYTLLELPVQKTSI